MGQNTPCGPLCIHRRLNRYYNLKDNVFQADWNNDPTKHGNRSISAAPPGYGPGNACRRAIFCCPGDLVAAKEAPPGKQTQPAAAPEAPKQLAFSIRLPLPITDQSTNRVKQFVSKALEKAQSQNVKPYLIFEFYIPPGQENFARDSNFWACYELAYFLTGDDLNAAKTVAYLPQSIQGHAILAVMACDDIIMASPDASIGPVGVDKSQISETRPHRIPRNCRPAPQIDRALGPGIVGSVTGNPIRANRGRHRIRHAPRSAR